MPRSTKQNPDQPGWRVEYQYSSPSAAATSYAKSREIAFARDARVYRTRLKGAPAVIIVGHGNPSRSLLTRFAKANAGGRCLGMVKLAL